MSYGEGLMIEMMIQEEIAYEESINRLRAAVAAGVWITADNASIKISLMSTHHIHNCVAMLNRKLPQYDSPFADIAESYIEAFNAELQARYPPKDAAEGFFDE